MPNKFIAGTTVLLAAIILSISVATPSYAITCTDRQKVCFCLLREELCQRATMPGRLRATFEYLYVERLLGEQGDRATM